MEFENFEDFIEEMIGHMRSNDSDAISLDRLEYYKNLFIDMKEELSIPMVEHCPHCMSENVFDMYPNHFCCIDCRGEWDGKYIKSCS